METQRGTFNLDNVSCGRVRVRGTAAVFKTHAL
jgi:hypothetical protein